MDTSGIYLVAIHRNAGGHPYAGEASGPYKPDDTVPMDWSAFLLRTTGSTDPDIYRVDGCEDRREACRRAVCRAEHGKAA